MASYKRVALAAIRVSEDRQRSTFDEEKMGELVSSISKHGLINPITVVDDGDGYFLLVAGERRLRAVTQLQWATVPVSVLDENDPSINTIIELEENVKRSDLTWQELCLAVRRFHTSCRDVNPEWTLEQTAEILSFDRTSVIRRIMVADGIIRNEEDIATSESFSRAYNILARRQERQRLASSEAVTSAVSNMFEGRAEAPKPAAAAENPITPAGTGAPAAAAPAPPPLPEPRPDPNYRIVQDNCLVFFANYEGPKFTFVHCDFPYGINYDKMNRGATDKLGRYDDGRDVYFDLIEGFLKLQDRVIAEAAHMMFWFSPRYWADTQTLLRSGGWRVYDNPLVWHKSDNVGVAPDPTREGRRTSEFAFHCIRGDLPISQPVATSFAAPTRASRPHPSEKPPAVLDHFFRLYVDKSTRMLDPTCGGGTSVAAAFRAGAVSAIGVEQDPGFAAIAEGALSAELEQED